MALHLRQEQLNPVDVFTDEDALLQFRIDDAVATSEHRIGHAVDCVTKLGYVYLFKNTTNGKVYVGQTVQKLLTRLQTHIRGNGCKPLFADIQHQHAFSIAALHRVELHGFDEEHRHTFRKMLNTLEHAEAERLQAFDTDKGYNATAISKEKDAGQFLLIDENDQRLYAKLAARSQDTHPTTLVAWCRAYRQWQDNVDPSGNIDGSAVSLDTLHALRALGRTSEAAAIAESLTHIPIPVSTAVSQWLHLFDTTQALHAAMAARQRGSSPDAAFLLERWIATRGRRDEAEELRAQEWTAICRLFARAVGLADDTLQQKRGVMQMLKLLRMLFVRERLQVDDAVLAPCIGTSQMTCARMKRYFATSISTTCTRPTK